MDTISDDIQLVNSPRIGDYCGMQILRYWLMVCALSVVIFPSEVSAHQDPVGDVHPQVVVENGRFAVYFRPNWDSGYSANQFRVIYSKLGELIAPRHLPSAEPKGYVPVWDGGSAKSFGRSEVRVDAQAKIAEFTGEDGISRSHRLLWKDGIMPFHMVEDFSASETHLALLGTFQDPDDPWHTELAVAVFDLHRLALPVIIRLGEVATIYDFPTCSNLIESNGQFHFAWMGRELGADVGGDGHALRLSSIDPVRNKSHSLKLDADYNWNTHLSMAAVEDRICIAWHGGKMYGGFIPAKIEKIFMVVPELK